MESGNFMTEEIKSICRYENIKSKYILQKIFNNLEKKIILNIVKYNKDIKERINININDFKEFSVKYSSVEIEIKPFSYQHCHLIHINEKDKIYYHIYFNNDKKEIKRNYININEKVEIIKIKIDYQIESFEELFYKCDYIESVFFKQFYRGMFYECSSLKDINFNNFNTNNATNMSGMFYKCSSLNTNMAAMFSRCSSLKELNLNNFNTNNVTNMDYMFYECSSLKELNLNNFNTNNVTNMSGMFSRCSNELIMKIKVQRNDIKEIAFK